MTVKQKLERMIEIASLGIELLDIMPEPTHMYEMLGTLYVVYDDEDIYLDAIQKTTERDWRIVENNLSNSGVEATMVKKGRSFILRVDIENKVRNTLKEQYAEKLQGYLQSV